MNRYQTLERRLGALIVDLIVVVAPLAALDYVILLLEPSPLVLMPWLIVSNFAGAAYNALLQGWYGQTLGKMLLRVKVVRYDDESPISMFQAFLREVPTVLFNTASFAGQAFAVLSGKEIDRTNPIPILNVLMFIAVPWFLAEVLCAFKTIKRRAIHDFIAGTVVIRTDLNIQPTVTGAPT